MEVSGDESSGDCWWDVSVCFLVVLLLISLVDMVCELDLLSVSDFESDGPQTLWVSRKCGTSVAPEGEQHMRANASMETTPVKSMLSPQRGYQSKWHRSTSGTGRLQLLGERRRKQEKLGQGRLLHRSLSWKRKARNAGRSELT